MDLLMLITLLFDFVIFGVFKKLLTSVLWSLHLNVIYNQIQSRTLYWLRFIFSLKWIPVVSIMIHSVLKFIMGTSFYTDIVGICNHIFKLPVFDIIFYYVFRLFVINPIVKPAVKPAVKNIEKKRVTSMWEKSNTPVDVKSKKVSKPVKKPIEPPSSTSSDMRSGSDTVTLSFDPADYDTIKIEHWAKYTNHKH